MTNSEGEAPSTKIFRGKKFLPPSGEIRGMREKNPARRCGRDQLYEEVPYRERVKNIL